MRPSNKVNATGVALLLLAIGCGCVGAESFSLPAKGVRIIELTNRLRIEIDGQLFTEYFSRDVPRPYYYPLIGPGNLARSTIIRITARFGLPMATSMGRIFGRNKRARAELSTKDLMRSNREKISASSNHGTNG